MTEEWRSVVGFDGLYSVSSFGQVRSDRPRERELEKRRPQFGAYVEDFDKNATGNTRLSD